MQRNESHGGLTYGVIAAAISVPAFLALAIGLTSATHQLSATHKEDAEYQRLEEVTGQARLLVESLQGDLDMIRTRALSLSRVRAMTPAGFPVAMPDSGGILHWMETRLAGARTGGALDETSTRISHPLWADAKEREPEYLHWLKTEFTGFHEGSWVARAPFGADHKREGLAVAFPIPDTTSGIVFALVDPIEAFASLKRLVRRGEGGNLRAYVVGSDGKVIAHSQPAYAGADFSKVAVFTETAKTVFNGRKSTGAGTLMAVDQIPVTAAFQRIGAWPMAVVVERAVPLEASFSRKLGGWRKVLGVGLVSFGTLVGLVLIASGWLWGRVRRAEEDLRDALVVSEARAGAVPREEDHVIAIFDQDLPAAMATATGASQAAQEIGEMQSLRNELQAARDAITSSQREAKVIAEFEQEAARLRDPRRVAGRLADAASRLCDGGPTLFFSFNENLGMATLQGDAGFAKGQSPVEMSFELGSDAINRVQELESKGKLASFAQYEPLAKVLLSRFGVAHFEAWGVTGYGPLGRHTGKPRLIGILVLLQAGSQTHLKQESLARIMRTTGLVYENSLLAR